VQSISPSPALFFRPSYGLCLSRRCRRALRQRDDKRSRIIIELMELSSQTALSFPVFENGELRVPAEMLRDSMSRVFLLTVERASEFTRSFAFIRRDGT